LDENTLTSTTVELATELTIAWLSNPNTRAQAEDIPAFLRSMHDAVVGLGEAPVEQPEAEPAPKHEPAVTVRKSLASPDHIISLIDGKPYKTLRRHLSRHGMTPEQYRERYGLKADYPMVAPAYAETRRDLAKKIGLGRKGGRIKDTGPAAEKAAPSRRRKQVKSNAEA
jgi:predicted transcriptional regulator